MARGTNSKSLKNLEARGRTPDWDESKKRRYLSVTDAGFNGALKLARSLGCNSVSDLLEKLGRMDNLIPLMYLQKLVKPPSNL